MDKQSYTTVIKPRSGWFDINIKELVGYRDLIFLFVKRTFVAYYKQTILGPAWAVIQPFLTSVIFTLVFGNIAGLAPSGVPAFIFYFGANVVWGYFSGALTQTSNTFTSNAAILGKVYFPRLVMPISTVISQMISFAIQFVFFLGFWIFYMATGAGGHPNWFALMLPLLLLELSLLSLGFGIIISAMTTKYRDLAMLVSFGTQLWMYATPVAYDMSYVPEKWMWLYMLNPVTPIINTFRYGFLGIGDFNLCYYLVSWGITVIVLIVGVLLFSRVEKTFMDTV